MENVHGILVMTLLEMLYFFWHSWIKLDAMLEMTSAKLELISDTDVYLFVEKGMR